jgi:SAM-dependent methyltransferase
MLQHTKDYLEQLNQNIDDKLKILDYIKGKNILDAGCGGGELTRILHRSGYNAYGIDLSDLSKEVFENMGMKQNFIQGNVMDITEYIEYGEIDTIIFSSVLHEVYSYNNFDINAVKLALQNAYKVLPKGGRIIIRDGIMSEDNTKRMIRFKDKLFAYMLNNYIKDFEGRQIYADWISENTVIMSNNDAMEFLYTATWGLESYNREVKEQFGIMTPSEYINFINNILFKSQIISFNHYLQEGYNYHLLNKINYYYTNGTISRLPDSTALFVIEKNTD